LRLRTPSSACSAVTGFTAHNQVWLRVNQLGHAVRVSGCYFHTKIFRRLSALSIAKLL
jgi:hypothetical protein